MEDEKKQSESSHHELSLITRTRNVFHAPHILCTGFALASTEFARRQAGHGLEGARKVWLVRESGPDGDIAERLARSDPFTSEHYAPMPDIFADAASKMLAESPCEVCGMHTCLLGQGLQRRLITKFSFQFLVNLSKPPRNVVRGGASALQVAAELQD
jgi:hypothetical protein